MDKEGALEAVLLSLSSISSIVIIVVIPIDF